MKLRTTYSNNLVIVEPTLMEGVAFIHE